MSIDQQPSVNKIEFSDNVYEANFAGGGEGLIDIRGVRRVHFSNESFNNNGEIIDDVQRLL